MKTNIERSVNRHNEMRCSIGCGGGRTIVISRQVKITDPDLSLKPAEVNWFGSSANGEHLRWFIAAMRLAQSTAELMDAGGFTARPDETIEL